MKGDLGALEPGNAEERTFRAKYRTRCARCDAYIEPGMTIRFRSGQSRAEHEDCVDYPDPEDDFEFG